MGETINASNGAGGGMPRDRLVRALFDEPVEFRDAANGGGLGTLTGHFAVFDQWTEIRSTWEGHFLERIAPGAFTKTFQENGDRMKVLYDHGHDPSIGNKPLGKPTALREDKQGAFYEVDLFDTSYNRDLLPALKAGQLGSSFRFTVMHDKKVDRPKRSDTNPDGIPERTILEARVAEFGPVTFPAYIGATAGMRSATDDFIAAELLADPEKLTWLLERRLAGKHTHPASAIQSPYYAASGTTMTSTVPTFNFTFPSYADSDQRALVEAVRQELTRAVWSTAYVNNLPDSSFLYIEAGGEKDGEGKTTPRSLRHFPVKDANGKVDLPHLRNALARIPQSNLPQSVKDAATAKAQKMLAAAGGGQNSADPDGETRFDSEDTSCLAQMIALGADYIAEQDEPEDEKNVPVMQDVIKTLEGLLQYEASEDEPAGDEDDGRSEPEPRGATTRETEPEPSEATTHDWRELLWLANTKTKAGK